MDPRDRAQPVKHLHLFLSRDPGHNSSCEARPTRCCGIKEPAVFFGKTVQTRPDYISDPFGQRHLVQWTHKTLDDALRDYLPITLKPKEYFADKKREPSRLPPEMIEESIRETMGSDEGLCELG